MCDEGDDARGGSLLGQKGSKCVGVSPRSGHGHARTLFPQRSSTAGGAVGIPTESFRLTIQVGVEGRKELGPGVFEGVVWRADGISQRVVGKSR